MRIDRLPELKALRVRIRPVAQRHDAQGYRLSDKDDDWFIRDATSKSVTISNVRTQHIVRLSPDNIHHFEPDASHPGHGLIELNAQVFLQGIDAHVERLVGRERQPGYNPVRGPGRNPVVIPIAGTRSKAAEALAIGTLGILLIAAFGGFKS
jgi:hypothetical protein